jgi:hypothetical protein
MTMMQRIDVSIVGFHTGGEDDRERKECHLQISKVVSNISMMIER